MIWIDINGNRIYSENEMIGDAISYPTQRDDWLKTILIGGVLSFLSFFIIPAFIIAGYQVRVLRYAATDEQAPPTFGDWGDLIVDGLKVFLIVIAYIFIIETVLFIGLMMESVVGTVIALVAALLLLVAIYLLPVALTNFALTGSIGAAFDISTITDAGFTSEYFIALVLAIAVGFVFNIVASFAMVLLFAGVFVMFYAIIVVCYLIGQGCGPALRQDTTEEFAT